MITKPQKRPDLGFTMIELLIAFVVFNIFGLMLFYLYRGTMSSFNASAWKQEKAAQGEIFWQILRKNLEEASNKNIIQESGTDLNVDIRQRPLNYRSIPPGTADGDRRGTILAWTRNRNNDAGLLEYQLMCRLILENRALTLEVQSISGSPPAGEILTKTLLTDVEAIVITCIPVRQSAESGEFLDPDSTTTFGADVTGTIAEISIVFTPPKNLRMPNIKVAQNSKFKIGVGSRERTLGEYDFSYPLD